MQTRRDVLKALILTLGGSSLLTACGGEATIAVTAPGANSGRFYTPRKLSFLTRISDLLIPRTTTPGALDVNVPGLMDALMADWASADTQAAHRLALTSLETRLLASLGGDFAAASETDAARTLENLDGRIFGGTEPNDGYREIKGLIAQAYFATEDGALLEQKWVATPGRWDPCIDL